MKTSLELSEAELSQAVANFVAQKIGRTVKVDVRYDVAIKTDMMDRPIGGHSIKAIATFSEEVQP